MVVVKVSRWASSVVSTRTVTLNYTAHETQSGPTQAHAKSLKWTVKSVKTTFIAKLGHSVGTITLRTRRLAPKNVLKCMAKTLGPNLAGVQLIGRIQPTMIWDIMASSAMVALRSPRMLTQRDVLSPTTFNLNRKRLNLLIHVIQLTTRKCVTSTSTQLLTSKAKLLRPNLSKRCAGVRWTAITASVAKC